MKLVQMTPSSQGILILSAHQKPLGDLLKFSRDTGIPRDSNGQKSWGTTAFGLFSLCLRGGRESFSSILSSFPSLSNFSVFFKWARTIYQAMMLSLAQGFPNFDMRVIPSGQSVKMQVLMRRGGVGGGEAEILCFQQVPRC